MKPLLTPMLEIPEAKIKRNPIKSALGMRRRPDSIQTARRDISLNSNEAKPNNT